MGRIRYNKGSLVSTIKAACKLSKSLDEAKIVVATSLGYAIVSCCYRPLQGHYLVYPDGRVELKDRDGTILMERVIFD